MNKDMISNDYQNYLISLGIYDLRNIARSVGVSKPTMRLKKELITEIIKIKTGEKAPSPKTKKGAPVKKHYTPLDMVYGPEDIANKPYIDFQNKNYLEVNDIEKVKKYDYSEKIYSGVLEIISNGYGFLRKQNFRPQISDVYVPAQIINGYALKNGDFICCYVKTDELGTVVLDKIASINGAEENDSDSVVKFDNLPCCYPVERLRLEKSDKSEIITRAIDLFCPIGKGQRGLVYTYSRVDEKTVFKAVASSLEKNYPQIKTYILLLDESSEEIADVINSVSSADVVYTTFGEECSKSISTTQLLFNRAKCLVEKGEDVVVLVDSITRLVKAYNNSLISNDKILSDGLDLKALTEPKKFFGSAKNIPNGGSLTIVASVSLEDEDNVNNFVVKEFKNSCNMEMTLSNELLNMRNNQIIDLARSMTLRDELLLSEDELKFLYYIRDKNISNSQIYELFAKTKNNAELLKNYATLLQ